MPLNIEVALIEAAATENRSLERLIGTVWPEAYRLALGILRDRGLAEDAAQEACAAMAVSLSSLKSAGAFRAWFYRLVVNESIAISRRQRDKAMPLDAAFETVEFDGAEALDLANALRQLPPEQRAVVLLHYYVGLSSSEIAVAVRFPSSTVRFHLMLARRALRRALSLAGHPASPEALSNAH